MAELLAAHTTFRLGGPAGTWVRATTESVLVEAVRRADEAGEPVLLVAGGSNLLVADKGFAGTVIEAATTGVAVDTTDAASGGGVLVTVAAGEPWDAFVERAVADGWIGVETLSGIPGSVGATPVQNVGAYGQEVAQTIARVRVWDRRLRGVRTFTAAECGFGYRTSRFKADPGRHVVLDVTFQFRQGRLGAPVEYAELARTLDVEPGSRAPAADVREAVLGLRAGKGMVLDPADHDTWSAGSFFTNPVVAADVVPDGAPAWRQPDGAMKTSAGWLIENAGFAKGYAVPGSTAAASLSTKHPLALTNRGAATTGDVLDLARTIRDEVDTRFGITLVNEPQLVACSL
ncbi:MAG: UDP-N-acetylmuramate dehydrogenase [Nocardioides sp.]